MRYLFLHQNFPGQFLHFVRHLVASKRNEVVFLSEPNANTIPGVRKVVYRLARPPAPDTHRTVQELEAAMLRAEAVARTAGSVKALGFSPDIIIGHHGWGELLNIRDVFPDVPLLGYYEYFYRLHGSDVDFDPEFPTDPADHPRIRAKNAINLLALQLGGHGQSPTEWQRSTYPDWAQQGIDILAEGVDLDLCRPRPAPRRSAETIGGVKIGLNEKLVTYVARDLEPYRGFHIMMRSLPDLLQGRSDVRVLVVGGDGVSYGARPAQGSWREVMLAELGSRIDPDRVHFVGRLRYPDYVRLLQRSDAHIYLTYPFVASWSLREALAVGCAVVGSDTAPVREFITDRRNGRLAPFLDPQAVARTVLEVLEDVKLAKRIRAGARKYAEAHLAMPDYLANYDALVGRMTGRR